MEDYQVNVYIEGLATYNLGIKYNETIGDIRKFLNLYPNENLAEKGTFTILPDNIVISKNMNLWVISNIENALESALENALEKLTHPIHIWNRGSDESLNVSIKSYLPFNLYERITELIREIFLNLEKRRDPCIDIFITIYYYQKNDNSYGGHICLFFITRKSIYKYTSWINYSTFNHQLNMSSISTPQNYYKIYSFKNNLDQSSYKILKSYSKMPHLYGDKEFDSFEESYYKKTIKIFEDMIKSIPGTFYSCLKPDWIEKEIKENKDIKHFKHFNIKTMETKNINEIEPYLDPPVEYL